jgi:ferric enterobactin receptor
MRPILLLLLLLGLFSIPQAKAQKIQNDTARVNKWITAPLDEVLDGFAEAYHIRFVFDRAEMHAYSVSDHYFQDKVKDIIKQICRTNGIYYAKQPDGTYFILKKPEDITRLRRQPMLAKAADNGTLTPTYKDEVLERAVPVKSVRTNFSLAGRITDNLTGESLPAASIKIKGTNITAVSNTDGYFNLQNVPADTSVLLVSYAGYQASAERLTPERVAQKLMISLLPADNALNEVVINGEHKEGVMNTDTRKVSMIQLTPAKLAVLPNIGERDILRAFQLMPGISGSNESSSGAYVRGGTPDQNLVLFDGFTVYQVDHLYGFYSAFNVNAVKDVQMYKGGFSSKFGGRLSSVTDISGKNGNNKTAGFGVDLSLLSVNVYGETPVSDKSSLLFSLRRSYQGPLYNKIFNKLNNTTATTGGGGGGGGGFGMGGGPGGGRANFQTQVASWFYDLNGKYTYTPDDKNIFSLSFYSGKDKLDNSRELGIPAALSSSVNSSSITDLTTYGNVGSSAKWSRRWTDKLYSNTLLSYSNFFSDRDRGNTSSITDSTGTTATTNNGTLENNNLKDYSAKSDWEWNVTNTGKILFGAFASSQRVKYDYTQNDTTVLINQNNQALTMGGYVELEQNFGKLRVQPGVRFTHYDLTGKLYIEPRFSASYAITKELMLKAATGRFYQYTNRVVREDILAGSKDFWVLANGSSIPVGSANHYIFGATYETDKYLFSVEGYYKQLSGLTEYSLRQTGAGGPMNPNSVITLEQNFYNGKGYAKGIEFMVQRKLGQYTGWVGYTLASAFNKFAVYGTDYFPAAQDVRHEFKSINLYQEGRWTFSATWIYATGRPYTAPVGSYTIDQAGSGTKTYFVISGKNTERLKAYHRLDAAITYDLIKTNTKKIGSIGFSFFNIYNRTNTWYREYSIVGNQVISTDVNYLGFTPNLTLSLKW